MRQRKLVASRAAFVSALLALLVGPAGAFEWNVFKDPEDGQFDLSNWLLERGSGFLPVPIIITEPALEGGLGLALAFFHKPNGEPVALADPNKEVGLPPSVSFGLGAYTGNDSWLAGGGHFASWKKDRIRYTGAIGLASINLEFYILNDPIEYNVDGVFFFQDIQFRIKRTPLFLGARYTLLDVDASFGRDQGPPRKVPNFNPDQADGRDGGLGLLAHWDSRDNIFAPTRGQDGLLVYTFNNEAFGGDFDYDKIEGKIFSYHPLGKRFILGLRLEGAQVSEGAPFYALPFVDLRGIPIGRYQDGFAGVGELEGLWNLVGRWTLVGFAGVGRIDGDIASISDAQTIGAGGVGFRYLLARRLGLKAGIDLAWSQENFAFYLAIGTGWR